MLSAGPNGPSRMAHLNISVKAIASRNSHIPLSPCSESIKYNKSDQ